MTGSAIDSLSFDLDSIASDDWHLQGIQFGLVDLNADRQAMTLSIEKMVLPKPFDKISLLDLKCNNLQLNDDEIVCRQGVGIVKSPWLDSTKVTVGFRISDSKKTLSIGNIKFAGGRVDIAAEYYQELWHLKLDGKAVELSKLNKLFKFEVVDVSSGQISLSVEAKLDASGLQQATLNAQLTDTMLQTQDGRYASEGLVCEFSLKVRRRGLRWSFDNEVRLTNGAVYFEPVFLELADTPVEFKAQGDWYEKSKRLGITDVSLKQQEVGAVLGRVDLDIEPELLVNSANLNLTTTRLDNLSAIYLQPFLEASAMDNLHFAGEADAQIDVVQQILTGISVKFTALDITDDEDKINLKGGEGFINWTGLLSTESQSQVSWQQLKVFDIPIQTSALSLTTDAGSLVLNQRAVLPVLGGNFNIEHFSWYQQQGQDPNVHFAGSIEDVSLQQLSTVLEWQPLSGKINGDIPGVRYSQGRLNIEGEIKAKLFDGEVRIKKLASSELFSDFSRFYADIEFDNLDLNQLTQTFDFGGMEGRLSGYARDIYLENWQPVSFSAWLGTPEGDTSKHRISQKAVNSISSIGGGGAVDGLSRSFLRFFDNFGYDRLGVGCLLQQGVCQLKGVGESGQGYYIVKGGGLPRIDVIGYNSRIDWDVLLIRLKRVTDSD